MSKNNDPIEAFATWWENEGREAADAGRAGPNEAAFWMARRAFFAAWEAAQRQELSNDEQNRAS